MNQSRKAALLLGLIALTALGTGLGRPAAVLAQSNQPTVTSVTPAFGSAKGTSVTITGAEFATNQQFQTASGQRFTAVQCASATSCTATTPALNVADGNVTTFRTLAVGQTGAARSNPFTAYGRPVIDGLSPNSGPILGGNTVTIAGATFPNGATLPGPVSVHFGSTQITDVTCSTSSSTCTVTAPAGTGTVQVTITTPGGTSAAASYTYIPPPTITSIAPDSGPTAGGTEVTIVGVNFSTESGATSISFGSAQATDVLCSSTTQCTARTPPGSAGAVQVTMTTPDGRSNPVTFTYTGAAPPAPPTPSAPVQPRCSRWSGPLALIIPWQNCTG